MAELNCPACKKEVVTLRIQYECPSGHVWGETVDRKVTDPPASSPKSSSLMMPFGKYKGTLVEDLPTDYIQWCLGNIDNLRDNLKEEMENQLALKSGKGVVRQSVTKKGTSFTFG